MLELCAFFVGLVIWIAVGLFCMHIGVYLGIKFDDWGH